MGLGIDVTKKIGSGLISKVLALLKRPLGWIVSKLLMRRTARISKKVLFGLVEKNGVRILDISSIGGKFKVASKVESGTLIFEFPEYYRDIFAEKGFKMNTSEVKVNNSIALKHLKSIIANIMPGADVDKKINNAIAAVAKKFYDDLSEGCQRSNNIMYGVRGINADEDNKSYLVRLYKTDYFSYNVIVKIYNELVASGTDFFNITKLSDFERVFPFMACFGVGGVLNLSFHGINGVIIGQRSRSVACPGAWHLSFDETYDPRDKDPFKIGGEYPDVKICMQRGLVEELGINIANFKYNVDKSCFAIIMTEKRFEVGLFVYVDLFIKNKKELYRSVSNVAFASDVDNEYEQVQIIPKNEVSTILYNSKNGATPEAPVIWNAFEEIDKSRGFLIKLLLKMDNILH